MGGRARVREVDDGERVGTVGSGQVEADCLRVSRAPDGTAVLTR